MKGENFGEMVGRLRREKGLTQEQLGDAVGVTVYAIRNYEHSHRKPDLGRAFFLAKALGVSVDVLAEKAAGE